MPGCSQCKYLDKENRFCTVAHKHRPLRNCLTPIIDGYHKKLFTGAKVLEIGCGSWSPTKNYCKKINAEWEGIDVLEVYKGKKTVATKIASVQSIPFNDNYFDFVISNQSLEHWEENYVNLNKGLSEAFRVLKIGGWMLMNVPIHYHGGYIFVSGDIERIKRLFEPYSKKLKIESWRNPSYPLKPIKNLDQLFWYSKLRNKSAYLLDIQAQKDTSVPYYDYPKLTVYGKISRGIREKGPIYYITVILLWVFRKSLNNKYLRGSSQGNSVS